MNALLVFSNVSYAYHGEGSAPRVLDGLSLEFSRHQTTVLLGPNGAGKTTLLSLAIGWLKPLKGQITLEGRPLSDYSRRELGRRLAIVPQYEHIPFDYTVLEYVLLGRAPHLPPLRMPGPRDCETAIESLHAAGIADKAERGVNTLSAGERQLATVARALTQQPEILLLDEPTSHLDLANKKHLVDVVRSLVPTGTTVVLTTHDPQVAVALADHVVLLSETGQLLRTGTCREVMTEQSLTAAYGTQVKVRVIDGGVFVLWDSPG